MGDSFIYNGNKKIVYEDSYPRRIIWGQNTPKAILINSLPSHYVFGIPGDAFPNAPPALQRARLTAS